MPYIIVNGEPWCNSDITWQLPISMACHDAGANNCCAHATAESAQRTIDAFLTVHPEATCEIDMGSCPQPAASPQRWNEDNDGETMADKLTPSTVIVTFHDLTTKVFDYSAQAAPIVREGALFIPQMEATIILPLSAIREIHITPPSE